LENDITTGYITYINIFLTLLIILIITISYPIAAPIILVFASIPITIGIIKGNTYINVAILIIIPIITFFIFKLPLSICGIIILCLFIPGIITGTLIKRKVRFFDLISINVLVYAFMLAISIYTINRNFNMNIIHNNIILPFAKSFLQKLINFSPEIEKIVSSQIMTQAVYRLFSAYIPTFAFLTFTLLGYIMLVTNKKILEQFKITAFNIPKLKYFKMPDGMRSILMLSVLCIFMSSSNMLYLTFSNVILVLLLGFCLQAFAVIEFLLTKINMKKIITVLIYSIFFSMFFILPLLLYYFVPIAVLLLNTYYFMLILALSIFGIIDSYIDFRRVSFDEKR
jgi:uncharacterized protein YybS (DUF2232 family)